MTFNTVLLNLRSAKNVGMIARSHLAFGGNYLILIGDSNKWNFKGGTSTYTRKINDLEKLLFFESFNDFLTWNNSNEKTLNLAIEIDKESKSSSQYDFPKNCNIILGNERTGIEKEILSKCDATVTIPQVNPIGSLNVAVSASIVFYEMGKSIQNSPQIKDYKFT